MRSIILSILLLLTFSNITGCSSASIKPLVSPNSDAAAKIVVFRPHTLMAMYNDMIVAIDGNEIAVLGNKQYLTANVPSGEHTVSVRGTAGFKSELTINANPSETLYFEAAGSSNNAINLIPGSVLLKSNFYIEQSESFNSTGLSAVPVTYN